MSGHSQFSNIKIRKEAQDAKRAKIFSKISSQIYTAAKQGGPAVDTNPTLRTLIEKAREVNMPKEKIEKAIDKASGKNSANFSEVTYEFYGPSAVAMIVKCITDNKNRTVNDVKSILNDFNLTLGSPGSAMYAFDSNMTPKFTNPVDENTKTKIEEISDAFHELEEVLEVYTNAG